MAGESFLLQRKNRTPQYRADRRNDGRVTGTIVLHDAENVTDLVGPDGGAEAVASWIRDVREDYGSYHEITDRDSDVPMAPYDYEVWHDTASNNWSVGLCVAWRKADLPRMTRAQRNQYYRALARSVLRAVRWFKRERGITVPIGRFLTRDEAMARRPGITTHSRMDPSRRSDPFGTGSVYEAEFLEVLADEAGNPTQEEDVMTPAQEKKLDQVLALLEKFDKKGVKDKWLRGATGGTNKTDKDGNRKDQSLRADTADLLRMARQGNRQAAEILANQALMRTALEALLEQTEGIDGAAALDILDRRLGEVAESIKATLVLSVEDQDANEDDPIDIEETNQ